ncbi:MAG TPA: hypothetical protein VK886_20695 [Vicinamibacterales bacterium]|nr:hypothetical protein [Vicinamibacterales bacterium]
MKWLLRGILALAVLYVALFGTVALAMMLGPEPFGLFMKYAPAPLVWRALPARQMWLWARDGTLAEGDEAPDFTLSWVDRCQTTTLSAHRGDRPVVLVFGSYT